MARVQRDGDSMIVGRSRFVTLLKSLAEARQALGRVRVDENRARQLCLRASASSALSSSALFANNSKPALAWVKPR